MTHMHCASSSTIFIMQDTYNQLSWNATLQHWNHHNDCSLFTKNAENMYFKLINNLLINFKCMFSAF